VGEHPYRMRVWGVGMALVVGFSAWLSLSVRDLGVLIISQPEIELDYAMGVLWWGVVAFGILAFGGDARRMLLVAWVGKFFVALIAMLFYEYYYPLDSTGYHRVMKTGREDTFPGVDFREDLMPSLTEAPPAVDGVTFGSVVQTANWFRVLMLVGSVTGPFYHSLKVAFAFLGLLGIWYFYRAVVVALGRPYPPAFYLLAFFPSIIFWSSILGKDPLQFLFAGIYAYGGAIWLVQGRPAAGWFLGVGLLGSYLLRPWLSTIGLATLFLATLLGRCRRWQVGLMLLAGTTLPLLSLGPLQAQTLLHLDFDQAQAFVTGQLQVFDILEMRGLSMAEETLQSSGSGVAFEPNTPVQGKMPLVMFSGLFRPLPFDITNPFTALAAIENTVILLLALLALFRFRWGYLRDPLVLWPTMYCLIWTTLYGFIVMANFGSGARYKLQIWPFLLMVILLLTHRKGRALLESRLPQKKLKPNEYPRAS